MPTKVELEAEVVRLTQERDALHEKIRAEVKRVANEQGWCEEGQRETLENLGVIPDTETYSALLTLKVRVKGELVRGEPNADFLDSSIAVVGDGEDLEQSLNLYLDSDWKNWIFRIEDQSITDFTKETHDG